jgi:hypothetical protein
MKYLLHFIFFFLLLGVINSCGDKSKRTEADKSLQKFDKIKWLTKENTDYPLRNEMLKNLIDSVTLNGLKYSKLIDLLGQPDRTDNGHLFYLISQQRMGGFPLSTKTLVIKLTSDSTVEWRKIHGGS